MKHPKQPKELPPEDYEITPLYAEFLNSKPLYPNNEAALVGVRKQLEELAAKNGMNVEEFLQEARTGKNYISDHVTALQLYRALGFFLSKQREAK